MKRIFIVLFVIAAASQLKAQQLTLKPADSALFKAHDNFKLTDTSLFKYPYSSPKSGQLALSKEFNKPNNNTEIFFSRMPVAKPGSNDRMPIAKPGDPNIKYTMLVKRIKVVDPLAKTSVANP